MKAVILGLTTVLFCSISFSDETLPDHGDQTVIVMLGTGTPFPNPARSGPSVAIVVNDTPYLVDFGPGVIRRAAAMTPEYGGNIIGLEAKRIKRAFLTHMHSDHTAGYADLILTPWTMGRDEPLEVYGPEGLRDMTAHLLKAYDLDIKYRLYGLEDANNQGWRVNAHEIKAGEIYKDENVRVEAFPVKHGSWPNAYAYRFTTPDKVIVISGDAALDDNVESYSKNADVLIHEVYADEGLSKRTDVWRRYHNDNHTSAIELGEMASRAKVKKLVLYHVLFFGSTQQQVLKEIKQGFDGSVVLSKDGDIY